jgi:FkbM family methyltransferase
VLTRKSALGLSIGAVLVAAAVSGYLGIRFGRQFENNKRCCLLTRGQNIRITLAELLGLTTFHSQTGQDKWVTEVMFPDVTNGYFVDVGSGDGIDGSNTKLIEEKGWKGICIDPFPENMASRTCQLFKEVVFERAGETVKFKVSGGIGGIESKLGRWKDAASHGDTVELTTVTLGDILERAHAPAYIQYMSLDIEGAEFKALEGLPFEKYTFGALNIEHNDEEPKRSQISELLRSHGYTRVHSWLQDEFYVRADP